MARSSRNYRNYFDAFANAFALALFEVRVNPKMNVRGRPPMESKSATFEELLSGTLGIYTSIAFVSKDTHS